MRLKCEPARLLQRHCGVLRWRVVEMRGLSATPSAPHQMDMPRRGSARPLPRHRGVLPRPRVLWVDDSYGRVFHPGQTARYTLRRHRGAAVGRIHCEAKTHFFEQNAHLCDRAGAVFQHIHSSTSGWCRAKPLCTKETCFRTECAAQRPGRGGDLSEQTHILEAASTCNPKEVWCREVPLQQGRECRA